MPSNRTRRVRAQVLTFTRTAAFHLQIGDCLLAGPGDGCGCGLRDERGTFVAEAAQELWARNKKEVIKTWPHPFACFGAILFDGAKLPAVASLGWSDKARGHFAILCEEVERARSQG